MSESSVRVRLINDETGWTSVVFVERELRSIRVPFYPDPSARWRREDEGYTFQEPGVIEFNRSASNDRDEGGLPIYRTRPRQKYVARSYLTLEYLRDSHSDPLHMLNMARPSDADPETVRVTRLKVDIEAHRRGKVPYEAVAFIVEGVACVVYGGQHTNRRYD